MPARRLQFDPEQPPKILVEMDVSRVVRIPGEKAATVWGYVGDYEVAVTFPDADGRVKSLVELHRLGEQVRKSRNAE